MQYLGLEYLWLLNIVAILNHRLWLLIKATSLEHRRLIRVGTAELTIHLHTWLLTALAHCVCVCLIMRRVKRTLEPES